jgi:hypothetical protein
LKELGTNRQPLFFDYGQFQGVTLSGDADFSDSALGRFSIDSSQIGGGLILNDSEVRCSYELKNSDIGFVLAERAGFGTGKSGGVGPNAVGGGEALHGIYSWWLKFWDPKKAELGTAGQRNARRLLTSPAARELFIKEDLTCKHNPMGDEAGIRFSILETHVKTNVCLRSFSWLHWPGDYNLEAHPKSALILNGTNVDVGLVVTFQPDDFDQTKIDEQTPALVGESRSFEAKGLTAGSLIFEFSEQKSIYGTQLDGLKFGRIHNNLANCEFKSETDVSHRTSGSSARPVPPTVEQVATWLSRNQKTGFLVATVHRICRRIRKHRRRCNVFASCSGESRIMG